MKVKAFDLLFYYKDDNNVLHVYGVISMEDVSEYTVKDLVVNDLEDLYNKDSNYIENNCKKYTYRTSFNIIRQLINDGELK